MTDLLTNLTWHALSGPHASFAAGTSTARRYATGFSPIVGFADALHPDLDALLPFCTPDEHFYAIGWSRPAPSTWQVDMESVIVKMIWDAPAPVADTLPDVVRLGTADVEQVLALAALTRPGPFSTRTIELGEYFGCFDADGRLVAMAGERMAAGTLREISGVCTHPDAQGKGYAKRLVTRLVAQQMRRGEVPVLHVMQGNAGARRIYERMGFRVHSEPVVRVISRR